MIILDIPLETASWNEYLGRKHWIVTKDKRLWVEEVGTAVLLLKANGRFPPSYAIEANEKRSVTVTSYRKRLIDIDNVCMKTVMDALVTNNLLKDDSPKWVDLTVRQEKCQKNEVPHTIIEVKKICQENTIQH